MGNESRTGVEWLGQQELRSCGKDRFKWRPCGAGQVEPGKVEPGKVEPGKVAGGRL